MAKMALVDGHVSDEERAMLAPHLDSAESVDALVEEAKRTSLAEILGGIDRYADRFFVALRAASMAAIDEHLDAREEALYAELVATLEITPEDRALIDESVAGLDAIEPPPMHPRIEQLFLSSSFR
jgi:tellurite resistance protein